MSKQRRPRRAHASPSQVAKRPAQAQQTQDSFSNPFTRLGYMQPNLMETAEYPLSRMTQNYAMLNSMYRNDWIARRIIDTIPEDMTKNWYEIKSQLKPEQVDTLKTEERKLGIQKALLDGLRWGRLYGGAAGILIVEGQEDMLDQPLDLRYILPGQFKGIIVADRWSGIYPETDLVQDLSDPDFGQPEYYNFAISELELARGIRVHHSRVLRFTGRDLPYVEKLAESYWGMSEIEHVYTELNKRNSASENIAGLIYQANVRTYKMSDLGQSLMMMDSNSQRELYQTLTMQNFLMSNMGMNVMDKEDDLITTQYSFGGISDVYELFMMDIAGAAEIPVTKLYGRSPAGMNSTGESDLRNYYDKVRQEQESKLRPIMDKLLSLLCVSVLGFVPDDLQYEFNPIRDTSEEERANLIQQSAAAVTSVFQAGLISQRTALKELRQGGEAYGMWSNVTDEEIANADDGTSAGMDEMGMGGMGDMGAMMGGAEGGAMPPEGAPASPANEPAEAEPNSTEKGGAPDEQAGQAVRANGGQNRAGQRNPKPQLKPTGKSHSAPAPDTGQKPAK